MFHVYTYREGLLARMAHDLRLTVHRYEVRLSGGKVVATFDPRSARVDGVARGEAVDPEGLSRADKASIERTLVADVVGSGEVRFEGRVAGGAASVVAGRLTLASGSAELLVPLTVQEDHVIVDTIVAPSQFGIRPYRALAGAIRLADRWRIRLVLPWPGGPLDGTEHRWVESG